MKITGKILKDNREKQNVSLSEVSATTKINTKVLIAIEEGDTDSLPQASFLRGFLRSYAKFLKLDPEHILQTYNEELGNTTAVEKPSLPEEELPHQEAPRAEKKKALSFDLKAILNHKSLTSSSLAVTGIIILLLLILGVKNLVDKYERERQTNEPTIASLETQSNNAENTAQLELGPQEKTKVEERPQIEEEKKEEKVAEEEEKKEPKREEKKLVEEKPKEEENKEEEKVAEKKPDPEPRPAVATKNLSHELIVEALDNLRINIYVDSESRKTIKLGANSVHVIKAFKKIELRLSDSGAANIIYNGQDLGVPGDLGKSMTLNFPK